jgi:SulP family sulfate permease
MLRVDAAQYSSQSVREQTAELASLAVSDAESTLPGTALPAPSDNGSPGSDTYRPDRLYKKPCPTDSFRPDVVAEASESESPTSGLPSRPSSSALTEMMRNSPPNGDDPPRNDTAADTASGAPTSTIGVESESEDHEQTSLIPKSSRAKDRHSYGTLGDVESQRAFDQRATQNIFSVTYAKLRKSGRLLLSPKSWDRRTIWREGVVHPVSLLPAVFLGLLLNILDALSYGMILFPLGESMFAQLGSDGISMFYVSTVIAQLVFSCGGSIFKGGIGSEMIEVVPFFHQMAFMILDRVGEDNPRSVLATTIVSFAMSSILTGVVFFLMGACKLGSLIGFFPRHILIGCIGGVGWFLVATGVEVSARLPGSLEYDVMTLRKLFQFDTVFLWTVPLFLAIGLIVSKRFVKSNFLVGGYFMLVAAIFYIVKLTFRIPLDTLRESGWVFAAPSSSNPWYHFYTLYGKEIRLNPRATLHTYWVGLDFSAVNWSALVDTIPAMFALTFFGVLHVPINVPALGISTGEDNLNVDRELIAHGISNVLSGFAGSIQVRALEKVEMKL